MTERRFDFDGRPARAVALDTIRAALDDEGLVLGQPGASARVREGIDGAGRYWVAIPDALVATRCGHPADGSCRRCR